MIAVMQAYLDGREIESRVKAKKVWVEASYPIWNFFDFEYRIAPRPPSIDWSHVSDEFDYLVQFPTGEGLFSTSRPVIRLEDGWSGWITDRGRTAEADTFASYRKGNVDWKDSLVERPK
jgi:hypothetical protein